MNNAEAMKCDIKLIVQLDKKLDYTNTQQVQKVYDALKNESKFQSSLGKRYENKLMQIIQEKQIRQCLICNQSVAGLDTVFCPECQKKLGKKPDGSGGSETSSAKETAAKKESGRETEKKKRIFSKRNIIIGVVLLVLLGAVLDGMSSDSGDAVQYLGKSQEAILEEYNASDFYYEADNLITNEGNNSQGKPYVSIMDEKVTSVSLESGMNSEYHVFGIYIGDDAERVQKILKDKNAAYDNAYSIPGILECYNLSYDGKKVQMIVTYADGIVERINITSYN